MPNMNPQKNPMPSQEPQVRAKNFLEVALGYTEAMAIDEAYRCLNCKHMPCVSGCPVGISIPSFIQKVKVGEFEEAYRIITESSSLPAVCGRVCPQESQCEGKCVRGIKGEAVAIGRLERFVADYHNANVTEQPKRPTPNGHRVAVVGSGPAGLTCAGDLAKKGYDVTVFEALHTAGGVLVYGIPEFRLPKAIVAKEKEAAELKKKYFGPEGELYKKRESLMTPIQEEIYNAIKDISDQKGYSLILDRASDAGIIFANPKIDISNEVLTKLGYN